MPQNDPFFVVKDEVQKMLVLARTQYQRWSRPAGDEFSRQESEFACDELKATLRSVDWDLEDLEETISIAEKNPNKFHIAEGELRERKQFIARTKATVKDIRDQMSQSHPAVDGQQREDTRVRQGLLTPNSGNDGSGFLQRKNKNKYISLDGESRTKRVQETFGGGGGLRYTRLDDDDDMSNERFITEETQANQQMIIRSQDETLDKMGSSVHVLKGMSKLIGNELDEQSVMLDEFAHEMETTETKLDSNMKKIAKVLHMSNDRRQWIAIGVLALALFIVILLFFLL